MSNWIGQSVSRIEDERLLKGKGRYLADVRIPGTLEAVFVRSTRSHAAIRGIDKRRALPAPGVVAVFTHEDIADHTAPICVAGEVHTPERLLKALKPLDRVHPTPLFPEKRTTYAGQPLAMVVAETLPQALDAMELVEVDYEELPAVTDPIAALEADAPLVEPEFGSNLVLSVGITKGNPKEAFERGDVVTVEEEFVTNAMSPRRSRRVATSIGEETKIVTLRTRLSGMAETSAGGRMSVDLF
jgi:aerobic carbon-monoxide dehydrogenase large subunit